VGDDDHPVGAEVAQLVLDGDGRPGVSDLAAGVIGWLTASLAGVAVFALGVACSSYARARRAPSQ
jgi:hypothetical protein